MPQINPTLPQDGNYVTAASVNVPFAAILGLLNGNLDADNVVNGGITLVKLADDITRGLTLVGQVIDWNSDGSAVPEGYQIADGSEITDARSARYGKNVSNCTNKFVRAVTTNANIMDTPQTGGADTINIAHTHTAAHTHTVPAHQHKLFEIGVNQGDWTSSDGVVTAGVDVSTGGATRVLGVNIAAGITSSFKSFASAELTTGSTTPTTSSGLSSSQSILPSYIGLVKLERIF